MTIEDKNASKKGIDITAYAKDALTRAIEYGLEVKFILNANEVQVVIESVATQKLLGMWLMRPITELNVIETLTQINEMLNRIDNRLLTTQ